MCCCRQKWAEQGKKGIGASLEMALTQKYLARDIAAGQLRFSSGLNTQKLVIIINRTRRRRHHR
jgi:hypothetical protein